MLILTRIIGESIMIGEDIKVAIFGLNGNQIKVGIDAPKSMAVHREEVFIKILKEKLALSGWAIAEEKENVINK